MRDAVSVVICTDKKLAFCGAITLYSAACNLTDHRQLDAYVVDIGIGEKNRLKYERILNLPNVSLHWLRPDLHRIQNLPTLSWLSIATYGRLLLPEMLPDDLERILYFDSDMLVLSDISELWEKQCNGNCVCVCQDSKYSKIRMCKTSNLMTELGLNPDAPYFNAGLMVIDMPAWKQNDISSKAFHLIRDHGKQFSHLDQDALNIALYQKWEKLDPAWNVTTATLPSFIDRDGESKNDIKNLHYTGEKPSSPFCLHPLRHLFWQYVRASGWYEKDWHDWRLRSLSRQAK